MDARSLIRQLHSEDLVIIPEDQLDYSEENREGDGYTDRTVTIQTRDGQLGIRSNMRFFTQPEKSFENPVEVGPYSVTSFGITLPSGLGTQDSFGFPRSFLVNEGGSLTKYTKDGVHFRDDGMGGKEITFLRMKTGSADKTVRLVDYGAVTYKETDDVSGFERFQYGIGKMFGLRD